jgi:hypothetical protein
VAYGHSLLEVLHVMSFWLKDSSFKGFCQPHTYFLIAGLETKEEFGNEDDEADDRGGNRSDKDGAGSDVFGVFRIRVIVRRCQIHIELDGGIETFGDENHPDRENDEQPFERSDVKIESEVDDDQRYEEVHPGVMCSFDKYADPASGMPETVRTLHDTEGFFLPV